MKRILLPTVILLSALMNAQVGMNTTKPKATLDIQAVPNADTNGILIPRVSSAQRSAFVNPEKGLMVYNLDLECYETNTGTPAEPKWQCLATAEKVQSLSIEPLGFEGNFRYRVNNDPLKNKIVFKVTNNTNSELTGLDLSYIRVDGNTQYVAEGQHDNVTIPANSSKILKYGISGGNWNNSKFTLRYDQYSSASMTLQVDTNDINPNTGLPKGNGGTANFGEMELKLFLVKDDTPSTPIDRTVTITADNPLKVKIPFTQGKGNYLAYESAPITLNDAEGNPREIKLKYPEGNLIIGTGEIEAEIVSVDGNPLNLPQTTLGNDQTIAQIPVKLNNTDKGTFDLIAYSGILDRNFGDGKHDFVYMPIKSPSGRIWLNNNLGAEYSRVHSDVFNPQEQAQYMTDVFAYGSLFQYRRAADGHELTKVENDVLVRNDVITNTLSADFTPNNAAIIANPLSTASIYSDRRYNWVDEDYLQAHQNEWDNLWTLNGGNNPCPDGFRVPTSYEIREESRYFPTFNKKGMFDYILKLVQGDRRLWLSNHNTTFMGNPSSANISTNGDEVTNHIRCIKHEN